MFFSRECKKTAKMPSCIRKNHIGYCPIHREWVDWQYGCSFCGLKKDDLLKKRPKDKDDDEDDMPQQNAKHSKQKGGKSESGKRTKSMN